jgi:hypothetical protein
MGPSSVRLLTAWEGACRRATRRLGGSKWHWVEVGGRGTTRVGRWELLRGIKSKME